MKKRKKSQKRMSALLIVILALLIFYVSVLAILYSWGILTSLKTKNDFAFNKIAFPESLAWENYGVVWQNFVVTSINQQGQKVATNMFGQIYNTIMYAGVGALILAIVPVIVAYPTAKFPCVMSGLIYTTVLVTMTIPVIGTTPSMLRLLQAWGIYDTFFSTYIMKMSFGGMYFLIYYAAFKTLSKEYYEAATIDGASEYRILFTIMIPLVKTTIYTVFLIQFINLWNDYNTSLLYLPSHPTLAYGVFVMSTSNEQELSITPVKLASGMITAIPILILFIIFRNKIMGNLTMGGVKE